MAKAHGLRLYRQQLYGSEAGGGVRPKLYTPLNREQSLRNMDYQGDFSTVRFIMFCNSIKHFLKWLMIKIYHDS